MKLQKTFSTRGFTLVEILVVVALVGFIAALGLMMSFGSLARSGVESERDLVVSLLQAQRSRALSNIHAHSHGVRLEENTIVLFEGDSYDLHDPHNQVISRNPEVSIEDVPVDIVFESLTGNSSAQIIVFSQSHKRAEVEVNEVGRIEW